MSPEADEAFLEQRSTALGHAEQIPLQRIAYRRATTSQNTVPYLPSTSASANQYPDSASSLYGCKTYEEVPSDEDEADPQHLEPHSEFVNRYSSAARIGTLPGIILVSTLLLTIATFSFLTFLWFAPHQNSFWRTIMVNGWATRAISVTSIVIRTVVDLQAGFIVAMVASLTFEAGLALLKDAALLSTARASAPRAWTLLLPLFHKHPESSRSAIFARQLRQLTIISLCITTYALQLCSTLLLSDLKTGQLHGIPRPMKLAYDLDYVHASIYWKATIQPRSSAWQRNPSSFPTFAEYAKTPSHQDHLDDTGVLLRAFLPIPEAKTRERVYEYSGYAVVLDSRVSCQPPKINDFSYSNQGEDGELRMWSFWGSFAPSISSDRLWVPQNPVGFICTIMSSQANGLAAPPSICQTNIYPDSVSSGNSAGGLFSQFSLNDTAPPGYWEASPNQTISPFGWGAAFLILYPFSTDETSTRYNNSSIDRTFESDVWTEVQVPMGTEGSAAGSPALNVSLCYAAWDSARLAVTATSSLNRTEPVATWNPEQGLFTDPDIVHQMSGSFGGLDNDARGVMTLVKKDSWVPDENDRLPASVRPFLQLFGDGSMTAGERGSAYWSMQANFSNVLYFTPTNLSEGVGVSLPSGDTTPDGSAAAAADDSIASLFHSIHSRTGSIAQALSSMITLLSSMAYYDQMPRFQVSNEPMVTLFVSVLFPQAYFGYSVVAVLLAVHNTLLGVTIGWFIFGTRYTLIGNYWQSIAQLDTPQTAALKAAGLTTKDRDVAKSLKKAGRAKERFRMGGLAVRECEVSLPGNAAPLGRTAHRLSMDD